MDNFVLFSYTYNFQKNIPVIIGLNTIKQSEFALERRYRHNGEYQNEAKEVNKIKFPPKNETLINTIADIPVDKIYYTLATTRDSSNKLTTYLLDSNLNFVELGNPRVSPMYFMDGKTEKNIIVWQETEKNIEFKTIENKKLVDSEINPIKKNLYKNHYSNYIDLTGDLFPELALNTVSDENVAGLSIYKFRDQFELIQEILFVQNIYGISYTFLDKNSVYYDLVVAQENENITDLVVYKNKKNFKENKDLSDIKKTLKNLKEMKFEGEIFDKKPYVTHTTQHKLISINKLGMQIGIHMAGLSLNGSLSIFAITSDKKIVVINLSTNYSEDDIELTKELSKFPNVLSVSAGDIAGEGQIGVVVNYENNGKYILGAKYFEKDIITSRVDLVTVFGEREKRGSYIPGSSFLMGLDNGARFKKFSQSGQNSYPSLYKPGVIVGLGETNFFLTYLLVSCPSFTNPEIYQVEFSIVPNTNCIFYLNGKNTLSFACYLESQDVHVVFISLSVFALIDLIILFYLTLQEKKLVNKSKGKSKMEQLLTVL